MISPRLSAAYDWTLSETADTITATFSFPPTFNLSCLKATLLQDNTEIEVSIPDQPMLLGGHLHNPATSVKIQHDAQARTASVTLTKAKPEPWNLIVTSWSPSTSQIDPKSAFVIWHILQQNGTPQMQQDSVHLLELSANAGFVPALLVFGRALLHSDETRAQGFEFIRTAATVYHDKSAASEFGFIMALSEETREQGLAELRALADQGTFEANWLLGQLYSPLCPGEFPDTDAAAAFEWFSRARAIHEDPDSLYEMARLLYNGPPGVERDRARAQELYEKAKAARPDLPAIDFVAAVAQKPLEEEGWSNWWITGAVAGVVGVFAGALFWHLRRENK